MVTIAKLNPHGYTPTSEQASNMSILCDRLNELSKACGMEFLINSGLRSWDQQAAVYKQLAEACGQPFDITKVPSHSMHLIGAAADIKDWGRKLQFWCLNNLPILAAIGLWMEHPDDQERVHLQCQPPKSGNRVFIA